MRMEKGRAAPGRREGEALAAEEKGKDSADERIVRAPRGG
jgi:hypothetical protein